MLSGPMITDSSVCSSLDLSEWSRESSKRSEWCSVSIWSDRQGTCRISENGVKAFSNTSSSSSVLFSQQLYIFFTQDTQLIWEIAVYVQFVSVGGQTGRWGSIAYRTACLDYYTMLQIKDVAHLIWERGTRWGRDITDFSMRFSGLKHHWKMLHKGAFQGIAKVWQQNTRQWKVNKTKVKLF